METLNECLVLLIYYHLVLFLMVSDIKIQYGLGYSLAATVCLLIALDLGIVFHQNHSSYMSNRLLLRTKAKLEQVYWSTIRSQLEWEKKYAEELHKAKKQWKKENKAAIKEFYRRDPELKLPVMEPIPVLPEHRMKVIIMAKKDFKTTVSIDEINRAIFEELGTFGDIIDLSRRQLCEGFIRPKEKEQIDFINEMPLPMIDIGPCPLEMNPELLRPRVKKYLDTFEQESKRRWEYLEDRHAQLGEIIKNKQKQDQLLQTYNDFSSRALNRGNQKLIELSELIKH